MVTKDKRIDVYIDNAQPFARPILQHLRELIHRACPDVEETIKWGFPHFCYQGILCSMASFQEHCAFGFWKGALINDVHKVMDKERQTAMGQFWRITSPDDLPADKVIVAYIKQAMKLNEDRVKLPRKAVTEKKKLVVPTYFLAALKKNPKALEVFESFPYSQQKDYVEWLSDAKQEATREKRLLTAILWLSEGKRRNWKYERAQ